MSQLQCTTISICQPIEYAYTANLCNQSVTEGQQIDAILANFLLLQLLFTILADLWLQIKSASFKCKNYTYYLLHLKAALLKEN